MVWSSTETEKAELNQYWYSSKTLETLKDEIEASPQNLSIAFLSTPSVFFICNESVQNRSVLFDIDPRWANIPNYCMFDFNKISQIPDEYIGKFDMCVIDPPFITEDVWQKYYDATKKLFKPTGPCQLLLTTIPENEMLLRNLFGSSIKTVAFRPSIPNLVYQYSMFLNYDAVSSALLVLNPEVD